jgi:hypothetical protein
MEDMSGVTSYGLDARDRVTNKMVTFAGGLTLSLSYTNDANGNCTDIRSGTTNGVYLHYDLDAMNRITNVLANSVPAAGYHFDLAANMDSLKYGNSVTNLSQFGVLNRLTNSIWNRSTVPLASFAYQLGRSGNRTNLTETVNTLVTNRSYAWSFDKLYRLTNEVISDLGSNGYTLDKVGNRTSRSSSVSGITNQSFTFSTNDWQSTDAYDNDGNTVWSTNGPLQGPFLYDPEDRVTNLNGSVFSGYSGDGIRVKKTVGGTNIYFLVDDRNPTGYAQVLEERGRFHESDAGLQLRFDHCWPTRVRFHLPSPLPPLLSHPRCPRKHEAAAECSRSGCWQLCVRGVRLFDSLEWSPRYLPPLLRRATRPRSRRLQPEKPAPQSNHRTIHHTRLV